MKFRHFGTITGEVCKECSIFYTHGIVRLYRQALTHEVLTHVVAQPKDTFRELTPSDIKSLDGALLGSGTIGKEGQYEVEIDGKRMDYEGSQVLVVLEIPFLSPMEGPEKKHATQFYAITTLQPEWQYTRDQSMAIARFDYCLSEKVTCAILKYFDIWVIVGQVVNCQNPRLKAAGVKVTAMDADLISDDLLGSATTDANGKFKIYYRSADFKRTFLSPVFNIETLGAAGPDLYFIITDAGGNILFAETKEDGKKPGRKDVGNCFCVTLCANYEGTPPGPNAIWTGVGDKFILSTMGNRNNFDDEGYGETDPVASSLKYAIHGVTNMTGQKPSPLAAGNPIEYRFRISHQPTANNLPALPESAFTKVIGVDPGLYASVRLGTLVRTVGGFALVPVDLHPLDLDSQGWVDVRKSVNRTLLAHPIYNPADLTDPGQSWIWADADEMIGLNTAALTVEETRSTFPGLKAGQAIPEAAKYDIERIAIRFEIRDQVTLAAMPGDGTTLNAMVINNDVVILKLGVENKDGVPVICDKFKDEDVFINYTVYHPHLKNVSIGISSASGYSSSVVNPPVPLFNNPRPGENQVSGLHYLLQPRPNVSCNYSVALTWGLLLHDGNNAYPDQSYGVPFYYEA